jgi:hypothetical protein
MGVSDNRQSRWGTRVLLVGLLLLVLAPFGFAAGRSLIDLDDPSPAVGRAQVITQGIAELPDDEYVMRIVRRIAPPLGDAKIGRRVLGFALATDEPILITEEEGENQFKDVARIAPGEAYLTLDNTRQIRASLSGQSTEYTSIEFVSPDRASDIGTGKLIYVSDVISTPSGQHDVDLVRNVLAQTDIANVPDTGGQILVLATDGAIDILSQQSGDKRLAAGESALFNAEALEIRPSENSAYGVPTNQLGSLTNMLQTDSPTAGYVVVVIGPEVPKTGEPTPTATLSATFPTQTPGPSTQPTTESEPSGAIAITGHLCQPGVTIETISDRSCPVLGDGFDLSLANADSSHTLADATRLDASWQWSDLPLGTYTLATTTYPANANDYFVPGSAAVGGSSATGYSVTLDQSAPNLILPVYFLQPPPQPTTSATTFTITVCQPGEAGPTNCTSPSQYQVDPRPYLVSADSLTTLTEANAQRTGDSYTWNLPAGTWQLYQDGWTSYYYVNGQLVEGGNAFTFVSDGASAVQYSVQDVYIVIQ